jgi:hypothetical protein
MSVDNPIPCIMCQQKIFFIRTRDVYTSGPKKGKPIYTVMSAETRLKHDCPKKNQKRTTELGDTSLYQPKKGEVKKKDYNLSYPTGIFCPVCNIEFNHFLAHGHKRTEVCLRCNIPIIECKGHGTFEVLEYHPYPQPDYIAVAHPNCGAIREPEPDYHRSWTHTCIGGTTKKVDITNSSQCQFCNKQF